MSAPPAVRALLACDLDGTLLTAAGVPALGIAEALEDLGARGARLVVCTGRPLHGAAKAVAALRADPVAYVCFHGALVVDAATGEWLRHLTIPGHVVSGIVRDAPSLGLSVTLYVGDVRCELAPAASGVALELAAPAGITRLVLSGDPARCAAALPALAASRGPSIRLERAGGGTVAIVPASADKGEGLRLVATHLGVPLARVVACGDSAADDSLLRTAGVSIAVGDV
ncbi:MAG: HAD hydrolase family protein, partial [Actinobacteria bacterium]|nr:HAD hydrolase family protein [Actinomycetota bacterium]